MKYFTYLNGKSIMLLSTYTAIAYSSDFKI